jgi:hypothetical protein
MDLRLHIVAIVSALLLFGLVFELVRRRRLQERYALAWLLSAAGLLALAVSGDLLEAFAGAVGIAYAPSAFFAVILGTVVLLLLHFSLVVSRMTDQAKVLAQRVAMLQQQVDELQRTQPRNPTPEVELV